METVLYNNECRISINDNVINCSYPSHFKTLRWKIALNETEIIYSEDEKIKCRFRIDEIQEFQFEMGNGAPGKSTEDYPAAIAYVILKSDGDPQGFFYFFIKEEYVLLNDTQAHDFCNKILNYIGERYAIPVNYKLSIDTKRKQRAIALLPLLLILTFFLLWLRLHFGH